LLGGAYERDPVREWETRESRRWTELVSRVEGYDWDRERGRVCVVLGTGTLLCEGFGGDAKGAGEAGLWERGSGYGYDCRLLAEAVAVEPWRAVSEEGYLHFDTHLST